MNSGELSLLNNWNTVVTHKTPNKLTNNNWIYGTESPVFWAVHVFILGCAKFSLCAYFELLFNVDNEKLKF